MRAFQFMKKEKAIIERFEVCFIGTSNEMSISAEGKSSDYINYYQGNIQRAIVKVNHYYEKVCYKNSYPKIDLVFDVPNEKNNFLKYRYIIHPGV